MFTKRGKFLLSSCLENTLTSVDIGSIYSGLSYSSRFSGPGVSANPNLSAVQEEDMAEANESLIQRDFVDNGTLVRGNP